jgi:phosphoribulokinase
MSQKHPIVAVTGASGAGTTVIQKAFGNIFLREGIRAAFVEGDSFRRYDRDEMRAVLAEAERNGKALSPYGPDVNRFDQLESLFKTYSETGSGRLRRYVRNADAMDSECAEGVFTDWESLAEDSDLLFYEGLHGGVVAHHWSRRKMSPSHNPLVIRERRNAEGKSGVDAAQYVDLLIGVVPVVNLEWIQKIHCDMNTKGYSPEATAAKIVKRMQDYVHFITPQFSITDINFQRVPLVDTSNPFIATEIPDTSECMVVVRFREPKKFDLPALKDKIDGAVMSRPNSILMPGSQMQQALDVICTPLINNLVAARRAVG